MIVFCQGGLGREIRVCISFVCTCVWGAGEVLCLCGFLGVFFCVCDCVCVEGGLGRLGFVLVLFVHVLGGARGGFVLVWIFRCVLLHL